MFNPILKKQCKKCGYKLDVENFKKSTRTKDGFQTRCIACSLKEQEYQKKRYADSNYRREKLDKQLQRYHEDLEYKKSKNKERADKLLDKYHEDPKYKVHVNISSQIRQSIKSKKNGQSWEKLVGYSLNQLMEHLELLFEDGMSWDNYGEWHIDHKTPKSWFEYSSYEDDNFRKCWALENLKPMWAKDNISKGNRFSD